MRVLHTLRRVAASLLLVVSCAGTLAYAQPLVKSAIQVDPGNTKQTGQNFGYRLTYNCSSTSGPCLNAEVVDLLPPEVQFISTVPASPTGDVAAINVTPNYMGSGRTRVQFVLINPLPAGNSGDLLVNVLFPNGTTPNGTVATNTADGINLGATPGTFTTPPVNVTAVASLQTSLQKTLETSPANLDMPESYRLRISVPNNPGALNLTAIGPVTDTLPPGTVFNGATPAADCQPGCIGTTPAIITWTSPCSLPLGPGGNCDITVNVTFPSATFPSGTNVTNSFTADATPLGQASANLGVGQVTHPVTTFVAAPGMSFAKNMLGGTPNPPTLNQTFSYELVPANNGNVPLDNLVITDTLPVEMQVASVSTGAWNGFSDFAAGTGVRVSYEKNTAPGVFTLWGSSPNAGTSTTLTAPPPGLGAGEYLTRIRWEFGQSQAGANASARPRITGQIINPDHAGGPVAFGDTIQNCADLTAVYTAGPSNITRNACRSFTLSGPFVQWNPAKDNLSGAGPFNPGQTVSWRLRVRSAAQSSDPAPLDGVFASDLLPVDLLFSSWTFDDQGTGLPAPQSFEQIPNFAGTGRTLLRWHWNAGSGNIGVNQQIWINVSTTIRSGAPSGSLSNDFTMNGSAPGLSQRCSGSSQADVLDLDGDGDTAESLCRATGTINVAPIAQLISSKQTMAVCDNDFTNTSSGTLEGSTINYRLRVQNVGTVPMQNIVLVDLLPRVGDTGVRDTTPRGSQWRPLLAAPIVPPPGTTLYYSTALNPCRGEVGGPTTGCDAPNWTTSAPTPFSDVTAFKVEFGARSLAAFDSVEFDFPMSAPSTLPAGQAFNSFAYQADRGDGLGSLAAEPQKVGVGAGTCTTAALGDFVWNDSDGDGSQDPGETGVNGIPVTLYSDGPDGIPGNTDDILLQHALTQDRAGAAGWYRFSGLAPGSYHVCMVVPANYLLTTANQGSDATDSDGDATTHCSGSVVLASNAEDLDTDFGLVQTAALGDYVWFDRNGDGIQNEPASDGVDGVSVRLFADNGNGSFDAGDALLAVTATATDAFSRPGYYAFNDLDPGQRYFVQFVLPAAATAFTGAHQGGDTSVDSDAGAAGVSGAIVLAPGEFNPHIDAGLLVPGGPLALGDQVWNDTDNDGIYEPQNGETGIDNVVLRLYRDVNNNGSADAGEYLAQTATATTSGFAGRYRFDNLAAGNYIVVVDASNFAGGHALAGLATSTGNDPAPDPDNDVNGDDNGSQSSGAIVASAPVTLSANGEPTSEDGDSNTNLTVDFGFAATAPKVFDYGDPPDARAGTGFGNYATTALNGGASHQLGVPNAPYLGDCVDADSGNAQNTAANADDSQGGLMTVGSCATAGDDEDGVTINSPMVPGSNASITVRSGGPSACTLNAWVDFNGDGEFGDTAAEQIASDLTVAAGATIALNPAVPLNARPGTSYARFRCASVGELGPTGPAPDGEVEDYRVTISGTDLGDAPDSYGTTLGSGGPSHLVSTTDPLRLGSCLDLEMDGQASPAANGDDNNTGSGAQFGNCFDDEDGVTFDSPVVACSVAALTVNAHAAGRLDAWIDFNADGDFGDAGEQIFSSQLLTAGDNALSAAVPCSAVGGSTYARFRLSTAGGLGPVGAAADGEVEDYAIPVASVDFGDAPLPYPTLLADNGAYHVVTPGFSLGASEDGEADGSPSVNADGDGADEDGISFPALGILDPCANPSINVFLTNSAGITTPRLDAWIDFNHDGDWSDAGERIANGTPLASGTNAINLTVPCGASPGPTYARFRLSSTGVAGPTGNAMDGEVEDYRLTIRGADFGDAPDSYATTLASNGARHGVLAGFSLGATIDEEDDGQPSPSADGDGVDEDGINFGADTAFIACSTHPLTITLTNTAAINAPRLDAWIDFDGDGQFNDPRDRVASGLALGAGANNLNVSVPCNVAAHAVSYARFRLSDGGIATATGAGSYGEVEDYAVSVLGQDFGDLPDPTYPTLLASNGARHVVLASGNPTLGSLVDTESDGQPTAAANGDDAAGDDEDGVSFPAPLVSGTSGHIIISTGATGGIVSAWIDFNQDGDMTDAGEHVVSDVPFAANSTQNLAFPVPLGIVSGTSYARVRISSVGGLAVDGPAVDGEVEDYSLSLIEEAPAIGLAKAAISVTSLSDHQAEIRFRLNVTNLGNTTLSGLQLDDDLGAAFASATAVSLVSASSATLSVDPGYDGISQIHLLTGTDTLAVGASAEVLLVVKVTLHPGSNSYFNSASVSGSSPGMQTVVDTSQNGDDTDPDNNGDATDNNDPTPVYLGSTPIPALQPLGLAILSLLLAGLALVEVRRRRAHS